MERVILKPGKEKSVLRRHPWIFSGAIQKGGGSSQSGETVQVESADGRVLGYGAISPKSQIRVRLWTFDTMDEITPSFFRKRLEQAINVRAHLFSSQTTAFRIVNSEPDGLPGLIVDRYADFLSCQFLSAGAQFWKKEIHSLLSQLLPVAGIYERSDGDSRQKEGLPPENGVLWGDAPPELLRIQEEGIGFWVSLATGHKTGFYLDQRENRSLMAKYSQNRRVLNCFSYTGGFGVQALKGGARTLTSIDASHDALEILKKNIELNHLDQGRSEIICGDVFHFLRAFRDQGQTYDLIVLDPPKFAASAQHVMKAARGYKDINLLAMKLLSPGGYLFTFSCSGHISPELFRKIVADAAIDSGREAHIVGHLSQAGDHPVSLTFPEGFYLKGLICKVW